MKSKELADPRIKQFCDLVSKGIEAWTEAGKLLCAIVKDRPDAYVDILSNNSYLTREILESFERIGKKEIYPYLLVDGSPGAKRLAAFAYDDQVKLFEAKVAVIVKVNGQYEERRKKVCELSNQEAALVFDVDRVRTVKEQLEIVRKPVHRTHNLSKTGYMEPESSAEQSLNGTPFEDIVKFLTVANDNLVEARSSFVLVKGDHARHDELITTALTLIGKVRFEIKNSESLKK